VTVTREQVVQTAIRLLDEGGLHHLTLRRLAAELGVQAPALYWHVRNKRELLDLMAEKLAAAAVPESLRRPAPGQPFWDWLTQRTLASWRQLRSHPDGAQVVAGNRPTPGTLPHIESLLGTFVAHGFPPGEALAAILALGNLVTGSVLEEQASAHRPAESLQRDRAVVRAVAEIDGYPLLASTLDAGPPADERVFEYGLRLMVDGLRARQAELAATAARHHAVPADADVRS
jgi:TetR/AcrR family tetracycline transcriptional repressor